MTISTNKIILSAAIFASTFFLVGCENDKVQTVPSGFSGGKTLDDSQGTGLLAEQLQSPSITNEVAQSDVDLDAEDRVFQLLFDSRMTMTKDSYYDNFGKEDAKKYLIESLTGICMELQNAKSNQYFRDTPGFPKDGSTNEFKPKNMLSTDSCPSGGAYKTATGQTLFKYSTAIRVRNKSNSNFDGKDWESMTVDEIEEKLKSGANLSGNPNHWYKVNVSK